MSFQQDGSHGGGRVLTSDSISKAIFQIATNTAKIQKGLDKYGTKADTADLRTEMYQAIFNQFFSSQLVEETRLMIKPASLELKKFCSSSENVISDF